MINDKTILKGRILKGRCASITFSNESKTLMRRINKHLIPQNRTHKTTKEARTNTCIALQTIDHVLCPPSYYGATSHKVSKCTWTKKRDLSWKKHLHYVTCAAVTAVSYNNSLKTIQIENKFSICLV